MGVSRREIVCGTSYADTPPASFARDSPAARIHDCRSSSWTLQAGNLSFAATLLRHSSARGRRGCTHHSGTPRSHRPADYYDLHSRLEPRGTGRTQPGGSTVITATQRRAIAWPLSRHSAPPTTSRKIRLRNRRDPLCGHEQGSGIQATSAAGITRDALRCHGRVMLRSLAVIRHSLQHMLATQLEVSRTT
jgi:hypothetical protein